MIFCANANRAASGGSGAAALGAVRSLSAGVMSQETWAAARFASIRLL